MTKCYGLSYFIHHGNITVDLGVMTMKGYYIGPKSEELDHNH